MAQLITIYNQTNGATNTVPDYDLNYWLQNGWGTLPPTSTIASTPTVNSQGMTVEQMTAQAYAANNQTYAGNPWPSKPPGETVGAGPNGRMFSYGTKLRGPEGVVTVSSQRWYGPEYQVVDSNTPNSSTASETQGMNQGETNQDGWSSSMKASYDALLQYIQELKNQGKVVNPAIEITPEMSAKFMEQAKTELSPYYGQLISQAQQDLQTGFERIQQDYEEQARDIGLSYGQQLEGAQESFARRGLEFSSDRTRTENLLAEGTRNALASAQRNALGRAKDFGTTGERKLGSAKLPSLSYLATQGQEPILGRPGQYGLTPGTRSLNLYQPLGGVAGEIERGQTYDIERRKRELELAQQQLKSNYYL